MSILARAAQVAIQVRERHPNPFYIVLIAVGVVFAITACAYGVMTVRGLDPHAADEGGLVGLMDQHGLTIMVAEIVLLGVLTALAIGTDDFWTRQAASGTSEASGGREPPES
jgi:H+/Cl- antiporter ClcA